jgi:hypothetical protein
MLCPVASPLHHVLPSPLPSSAPLGAPSRRPRFKIRIIPHTTAIDATEVALAKAVVAMVGGTHPTISMAQLLYLLSQHYQVMKDEV